MSFFGAYFNYREPYQVLVDSTFCQAALREKVHVIEQLEKLFQSPAKTVTTQCIIMESESLGAALIGATKIVKQFHVHKCGHEGKPVSAADCIMSMAKGGRYIVASQDRALQERLRRVPGRCLLYLHRSNPVLEEPSEASKKFVQKQAANLLSNETEKRITEMKKQRGLDPPPLAERKQQKRKGPKNPNPLSCKKSKRPVQPLSSSSNGVADNKAKRKRIKLPAHVKKAIADTK